MVVRISDKTQNYSKVTKLLVKPFNLYMNSILAVYDTNFMFIVRPPLEGLPFLNLNHGYYIYLFRVIMLGVIGLSLFHLPFIVKERKSCETESDFNIA